MSDPSPDPSKALPPVVAPSGRYIAQMFLVPGLIVAGAVVLLLGFSWLAGGVKSRDKFLADLASPNPDIRWRTASDLAQVLTRDPDLASDPVFGLRLADLLRQALGDLEKAEAAAAVAGLEGDAATRKDRQDAEARRAAVQYLAACVGNLMTPVGAPVLGELAKKSPSRDPKTDALLRRQAVWALAALGSNLRKYAALPEARQKEIVAEIEAAADKPEYGAAARQSADFLTKRAAFPPIAALLACSEADDPFLRKQTALALGFWDATAEENKQIDAALMRLARDDGHGTSIEVQKGD
ncbi:MAG: hypothetical protein U0746_10690 [Gemmataceae bacterium]